MLVVKSVLSTATLAGLFSNQVGGFYECLNKFRNSQLESLMFTWKLWMATFSTDKDKRRIKVGIKKL